MLLVAIKLPAFLCLRGLDSVLVCSRTVPSFVQAQSKADPRRTQQVQTSPHLEVHEKNIKVEFMNEFTGKRSLFSLPDFGMPPPVWVWEMGTKWGILRI